MGSVSSIVSMMSDITGQSINQSITDLCSAISLEAVGHIKQFGFKWLVSSY